MRASIEDSWDFFSKDTVNSNIVLVRLTGEDNLTDDITTIKLDETKLLL